ncbi:MAG TPA: hypothetical protein VFB82_07440, partial [Blastocatellia bacterium]|nr:hypothetical protein [Blastocatellia bacterium]
VDSFDDFVGVHSSPYTGNVTRLATAVKVGAGVVRARIARSAMPARSVKSVIVLRTIRAGTSPAPTMGPGLIRKGALVRLLRNTMR